MREKYTYVCINIVATVAFGASQLKNISEFTSLVYCNCYDLNQSWIKNTNCKNGNSRK